MPKKTAEELQDEKFEDWYDEYLDELSETGLGCMADRKQARRLFDKGYSASKAARDDARFMQTGEW